jgi:hypothetical protein
MATVINRSVSAAAALLLHVAVLVGLPVSPAAISPDILAREYPAPLAVSLLIHAGDSLRREAVSSVVVSPSLQTISVGEPAPLLVEPVLADSFELALEAREAPDVAELERLQGVYSGQLHARVARRLQSELPALAELPVPCRVLVIQNEDGSVVDVDTAECHADDITRAYVNRAVRAASPLPLPPDGLAMGSYLTLSLSTQGRNE